MELSIFTEGQELISASRAAKKCGYAGDYIGQLCRSKKIPGKLIGKTWYVELPALLEYKKNQKAKKNGGGRQKIDLSRTEVFSIGNLPSPHAVALRGVKQVNFLSESENVLFLPPLSKKNKYVEPVLTPKFFTEAVALSLAFVISFSALFGTLNSTEPVLSNLVEEKIERLSHLPLDGGEIVAATFLSSLSGSLELFLKSFDELKELALGNILPRPQIAQGPEMPATKYVPRTATPQMAVEPAETPTAVTETTRPLSLDSIKSELKTELENYIRIQIASGSAPVTVYTSGPTFNTTVLREEILLADTRPTITRQSDSDSGRTSSLINSLTDGGSFINTTISGGTITDVTGNFPNLTFHTATGTAATTTNFFSDTASSTNLFSSIATLGMLNFTNALGSNATVTDYLYAGTASSTSLFSTNASFGNATSSTFAISGNGSGLTFYGTGNHDITAPNGTLRIGANTIIGNIIPLDSTIDMGTAGNRFDKIYADEINATTIVGSIVGGNVTSEALSINSDNVSADTEDSFLSFERGSLSPNALLQWDSTNDRFVFNSDLSVTSGVGSGNFLVMGSTTLQDFTFQNATGTNATTTNLYISGLASTTELRANTAYFGGNVGIGTTSPQTILALYGSAPAITLQDSSGGKQEYRLRNLGTGSFDIYNGTLGASRFVIGSDGNTAIGSTTISEAKLFVYGGANVDIRAASAIENSTVEVQADDYDTNFQSAYLQYVGSSIAGNVFGSIPNADLARLVFQSPANAAIYTIGSAPLIFGTNNSEAGRFTSGGNFGIATTSPSFKLSVSGSGFFDGGTLTASSVVATSSITTPLLTSTNLLLNGSTTLQDLTFVNATGTNATTTNLSFSNNLTGPENFIVNSSGNVGIGTVSPAFGLNIVTSAYNLPASSGSQLGGILRLKGVNAPILDFGVAEAGLWMQSYSSSDLSSTNNLLINPNGGNVGIGSTTPFAALGVENTGSGVSFAVNDEASDSTPFVIDASGNVGVGKSNPSHRLQVKTSENSQGISLLDSANVENARLRTNALGGDLLLNNNSGTTKTQLSGATGANSYFDNGGKLGIGTTSPSHILTATNSSAPQLALTDGSLTSNAWTFRSLGNFLYIATSSPSSLATSSATALTINPDGNVGIGTTNPGANTLSVNGNVFVPTQTGRFNIGLYGTISETGGGLAYITGNAITSYAGANNTVIKTQTDPGQFMRMRYDTGISFHTNLTGAAGVTFADTANQRMIIDMTGNVGIGTTTPFAQLSIAGSNSGTTLIAADAISSFSGNLLDLKVASSTVFSVNELGALALNGSTTLQNFTFQNATGTNATTTNLFVSGRASTTELRANTAYFGGNVGIGTAEPKEKLDLGGALGTTGGNIILGTYNATDSRYLGVGVGSSGIFSANSGFSGLEFGPPAGTGEGYIAFHTHDKDASSGEKVRIDKLGNLGIGTTTPQWKTQISGTAAPQLTLSDSGLITSNHWSFRNSNGTLYFATSSPTSFATSTNPSFMIDGTSGYVGVGTASPLSPLHVFNANDGTSIGRFSSNGESQLTIHSDADANSADTDAYLRFVIDSGVGTLKTILGYDQGLDKAIFGYNASNVLVVDSSGNVGIGDTTPSVKLEVHDTGEARFVLRSDSDANSADTDVLMRYEIDAGTVKGISGYDQGLDKFGFGYGTSFGIHMDSSNNVGIGTSTPPALLSLNDPAGKDSFYIGSSTPKFIVKDSGNIGIGTTPDAAYLLHARQDGNANKFITIQNNTDGTAANAALRTQANTAQQNFQSHADSRVVSRFGVTLGGWNELLSVLGNGLAIGTLGSAPLVLGTASLPAIYIDTSQRVGIGTSTPPALLTLNDPAGTDSFYIGSSTPKFIIKDSGNVGIGTSSPVYSLHVDKSQNAGTYITVTNAFAGASNAALGAFRMSSNGGDSLLFRTSTNFSNATFADDTVLQDNGGGDIVLFGAAEIVRFANGGNVGIGVTNPQQKLTVAGSVAFQGLGTGAGSGTLCYTSPTGLLSTSTTGCTGSSIRFKDNVEDLSYGLSEVMKMRPVAFDYKAEKFIPGHQVGFIAEEMYEIIPEVVGFKDGVAENIDYGKITSVLVKAIKDFYAEFTQVKATVLAFAERLVSRELVATERLCIGNTCINEEQLAGLLNQSGQSGSSPSPAPAPAPEPEPEPESAPETETEAEGEIEATPESAPEPSPEPESEVETEPTVETFEEPASEPAPEPIVETAPAEAAPESSELAPEISLGE